MKMKFFATYREITGCKEVEMPAPYDVSELLERLCERYGKAMEKKLFNEDGSLSEDAIILVNGRHIAHIAGKGTPLTELDNVSLFPMVAGG